ncbi:MAG: alpha/beta hydrolase [Nevskia sp.]|nr:alpha/beta hydrolase [Nevskia sp.]
MNDESQIPAIEAPPLRLLALETRVLAEMPWFMLRGTDIADLPRGRGQPVMIVPGFGAGDVATLPLRRALSKLGHAAYGWEQGTNLGMRPAVKNALGLRLQKLSAEHGGAPVSLIGWSLGGVFVREMARHQPALVRRVLTLGSPISGRPDANNMLALFRLANRGKPVNVDWEGFRKRMSPPPVPCTAIYSKSDGIVAWRCCLESAAPNTECVEVRGSHFGLVVNRQVLRVIAERLA